MTPDQFKAWFEGFCEGVGDAPTPEQWAKVKAKVGELREKPLVNLRDEYQRYFETEPPREAPRVARGGFGNVSFANPAAETLVKEAGIEGDLGGTRVLCGATGRDLGRAD